MKSTVAIIVAIMLAGCAARPTRADRALQEYIQTNESRVMSGELPRSTYYHGLYNTALAANAPGFFLKNTNTMIAAATQLESGEITAEQYEQIRRDVIASNQSASEERATQARQDYDRRQAVAAQQLAASAALFAASAPRPSQAYAPAANDYDWAWDQFYQQGVLVWACRGIQTGMFADNSRCTYKPQNDFRWPDKWVR